jgi:hypothetical protein
MLDIEEKFVHGLLVGLGELHGVVIVVQGVLPGVEQEGDPQLSGRVLLQHLLISSRNTRYQPP